MREAVQIPGLRDSQTLLGEFKDREYLLPLHARKPQYKVVHTGSVFEILEKSLYWHARSPEKPHTADFPGNALNSRTLIPIEHPCSIAVLFWRNKDQNLRGRDYPSGSKALDERSRVSVRFPVGYQGPKGVLGAKNWWLDYPH